MGGLVASVPSHASGTFPDNSNPCAGCRDVPASSGPAEAGNFVLATAPILGVRRPRGSHGKGLGAPVRELRIRHVRRHRVDNDPLGPVLACPLLSLPVPAASDEKLSKMP